VAPIPRYAVGLVRIFVTIGTGIAVATAWRSQVSRALVPPILVGITIHTVWFYQYQRFAFTWAPETGLLLAWLVIEKSERIISKASRLRRAPIGATVLLFFFFSIVAGFHSSRAHHEEWEEGAPSPNVAVVADLVRRDSRCDSGVIASPEPELAYHLDRRVWFAGDKELFVRSDVRPKGLRDFISRTGVHCVVTADEPHAWLAQWGVPEEEATIEGPGRPWKVYVR
jgi:hypothetical protein